MTDPAKKTHKLLQADVTVVAVLYQSEDGKAEVVQKHGDWEDVLHHVMVVYSHVWAAGLERTIRVRIGDHHAVLVAGTDDGIRRVAVVYTTPSPVIKSLSRMVRSAIGLRRRDPMPGAGEQRVVGGGG